MAEDGTKNCYHSQAGNNFQRRLSIFNSLADRHIALVDFVAGFTVSRFEKGHTVYMYNVEINPFNEHNVLVGVRAVPVRHTVHYLFLGFNSIIF